MVYPDEKYTLRIETDSGNYRISPEEQQKMDQDLDTLRRAVRSFPSPDLKVMILKNSRTGEIHVKTSLHLPSRTLFTGDRDVLLHPAWERCIRKLVNKVGSYKEQLERKPEYSKTIEGTRHEFHPQRAPDLEAIDRAVEELDYVAFHQAIAVYEEPVSLRAGRWIERYPEAAARLGNGLVISEIVEEVFLNAFEAWDSRPRDVPLQDWLMEFVDPSIQMLLENADEEKENLSFIESAKEAELGERRT